MTAGLNVSCGLLAATPVSTIDSPSAIMMNSWQRSARWPPSIVQSLVSDRPRPGV